jgi:hypothetical protein
VAEAARAASGATLGDSHQTRLQRHKHEQEEAGEVAVWAMAGTPAPATGDKVELAVQPPNARMAATMVTANRIGRSIMAALRGLAGGSSPAPDDGRHDLLRAPGAGRVNLSPYNLALLLGLAQAEKKRPAEAGLS